MMSAAQMSIVKPGAAWDAVLSRLVARGLSDIYFDYRYVELYASADAVAEGFLYEEGEHLFFFPNLIRPVSSTVSEEDYFDFESAYGYSGPVSSSEDVSFLGNAWSAFQDYCSKRRILAGFVRFHPLYENTRWVAGGRLKPLFDRFTVTLNLRQSESQVWQNYAKDNQNRIRKAQQAGVIVIEADGVDALKTFGEFYTKRMQELKAADEYFFGEEYFRKISLWPSARYRVYFARYESKTIGGALVLFSDRFVHYSLSGSLRPFLKYGPNNILRHAVITRLLNGGWERIHFGGGLSSNPEDTLLQFKEKFSKEKAQFHIGKYVADAAAYEAVCDRWAGQHPDLVPLYGNEILRYRRA
jgi:hypothetical protein